MSDDLVDLIHNSQWVVGFPSGSGGNGGNLIGAIHEQFVNTFGSASLPHILHDLPGLQISEDFPSGFIDFPANVGSNIYVVPFGQLTGGLPSELSPPLLMAHLLPYIEQ